MILHHGDIWNRGWKNADLFLITANSTVKRNGALVMGAGIARQARDRFPNLDHVLGKQIKRRCGSGGFYGLLISPRWPRAKLGLFQVKYDWKTKADLRLITASAKRLYDFAVKHPDKRIDLNFPGIGSGKLDVEDVWPIVVNLPDNVHIWTRYEFDIPPRGSCEPVEFDEPEESGTDHQMTKAEAQAKARRLVAESAQRQAEALKTLGW